MDAGWATWNAQEGAGGAVSTPSHQSRGACMLSKGFWVLFPRNLGTRNALGIGGRPMQASVPELTSGVAPARAEAPAAPEAGPGMCGGGGGTGRGLGGHSSTNQMSSWLRLGLPAHCVLSPQPAGGSGVGGLCVCHSFCRRWDSGLERVLSEVSPPVQGTQDSNLGLPDSAA